MSFVDENNNPITPLTAKYRVDDVLSKEVVVAETPFTPTAPTHDIVIAATDNKILNAKLKKEYRELTVTFTYGSGRQGVSQYTYGVKNLSFVS